MFVVGNWSEQEMQATLLTRLTLGPGLLVFATAKPVKKKGAALDDRSGARELELKFDGWLGPAELVAASEE